MSARTIGFGLLNQAQVRTGVELFEARVGARLVGAPGPWRWRVYTRGVLPPEWEGVRGYEQVVCAPARRVRGGRLWSEQVSWARELAARPVDLLACPAFFPPAGIRVPFVLTVHDLSVLERPGDYPPITRAYVAPLLRSLATRAARLTTPSAWVRERCAELLGFPIERIDVVYTGVEPRWYGDAAADAATPRADAEPFWLSCGTLQPRKNLEVVVRALGLLRARGETPPRLVCAGGAGRYAPRLLALARERGVADRVEIAGRVDDATLGRLYRECAAFVYPSWIEGFGVPPLEAMAAGARVIAARGSCLPEILGDTPAWADAGDPESWCAAWTQVRGESPATRAATAKAARTWVRRYTWEDTAARWRGSLERAEADLPARPRPAASAAALVPPATAAPDARPVALVLSPRLPWPLDDGGRIGLWQVTWSAARERQVVLLCFVPPGTEHDPLPPPLAVPGIEVVRVPHRPPNALLALLAGLVGPLPYTLARYRDARFERELRRLVAERRPEVALVNHLHLAPYVDALGDVPMVLREHNVEHTWMARYAASLPAGPRRLYAAFQARRLRTAEAAWCARAALVLAVQEHEERELRSLAPGTPVETLPIGVDFGRFHARAPGDPPTVVLVGSFAWAPNVQGALRFLREGWPRVVAGFPTARLRVAGKAPPPEIVEATRAPGVELAGHVPSMEAEFARATALVVPLWVGAGARVKIVEALAAGLPVVSTAIGAEGLELQPGVHFVEGESPAELADAILRLLRDPEARERIAGAGRRHADARWSLEAVAAQQNAACARVVAARLRGTNAAS